APYIARKMWREKADNSIDSRLDGATRDLLGGIDAEHPKSSIFEAAKQRAVVGAYFHHQTVCRRPEAIDDVAGVILKMPDENRRGSRDVHVILVEHLRIHHVEELHVRAALAQVNIKRKVRLGLRKRLTPHERVGKRG